MEKNVHANIGGSSISGVLALLGAVLVVLKLLNMIQITWFWALLPLAIACFPMLIGILLILFAGLWYAVRGLFSLFD